MNKSINLEDAAIDKEIYSFSKIQTFNHCKYAYLLNYIRCCKSCVYYDTISGICKNKNTSNIQQNAMSVCDEFARCTIEDNAFSQYGTLVHSLLEQYERGELEVYDLLDKYKSSFDDKITYPFPITRANLENIYFNDGITFFKEFDGFDDVNILGVEEEFLEEIDHDFLIRGFVDLIYLDKDGKLIVQDWKSKSKFKNKEELSHYKHQLYLYAIYIKRKYDRFPDLMRFYLFRKQIPVDIVFDQQEFEETLQWIKNSVHNIRKCNNWAATYDSFFCKHLCGFRNNCKVAIENNN